MSTKKPVTIRVLFPHRACRLCAVLALGWAIAATAQVAKPSPGATQDIDAPTRDQLRLLQAEKASRSPTQKKLDSQLLYSLRQQRFGAPVTGVPALKPALALEADGRVL